MDKVLWLLRAWKHFKLEGSSSFVKGAFQLNFEDGWERQTVIKRLQDDKKASIKKGT